MTQKQKRLAEEYLVDCNATQAAIRAGYSARSAQQIAHHIVKRPEVAAYLHQRQAELATELGLTQERVLQELAYIGFARLEDFATIENGVVCMKDTKEVRPEKLGALAYVEQGNAGIKLKLNDKEKALELLGKHLGLWDGKGREQPGDSGLLEALTKRAGEVWGDEDEDEDGGMRNAEGGMRNAEGDE